MRRRQHVAFFLAFILLWGCRTGRDYSSPDGPWFTSGPRAPPANERADVDTLRQVSFNIEFALRVDSAIAAIQSTAALRGADVIMLREMDEQGTQRMADALGLWYVYYPAIFHIKTRRNFGNAVLSRWPIVEDRKIILPHASRFVHTHRSATAATVRVGASLVCVYSTHLGILVNIGSTSLYGVCKAPTARPPALCSMCAAPAITAQFGQPAFSLKIANPLLSPAEATTGVNCAISIL